MKRARGRLTTIGNEGRRLEEYIQILRDAGVRRLCDVRRDAVSRKKGFSKGSLSRACEAAGIAYQHLPQLGIAAAERRALKTEADQDALFEKYVRDPIPRQGAALDGIAGHVRSGEAVALTCFERDPDRCHRRRVAEAPEKRLRARTTHLQNPLFRILGTGAGNLN